MKRFFALLLFLLCAMEVRADYITATLSVTNAPVNGSTIAVGSDSRYWTNGTITILQSQIAIAGNNILQASNLFNQTAQYQFGVPGYFVQWDGVSSNVVFQAIAPFSISISSGWAVIVYQTNVATPILYVGVNSNLNAAGMAFASSQNRTIMASGVVAGINANATNSLATNTPAVANLVDLFNQQSLSNKILFLVNIYSGTISNVTLTNCNYSGTVSNLTNGTWTGAILTNGQNFGTPFRSPGSGNNSENFGLGSLASGDNSAAFGFNSNATNTGAAAFGQNSKAYGLHAAAIGHAAQATNTQTTAVGFASEAFGNMSTALGQNAQALVDHQIMLGTAFEFVQFPGGAFHVGTDTNLTTAGTNSLGGAIQFPRFNNISLANGVNQDVNLGTNTVTKLSGMTAAFTTAGFTGGIDDRIVFVQNSSAFQWTINNQSGFESTAANRIYTGTGADVVLSSNAWAMFKYDSSVSLWLMLFASGQPSSGGSGAFSGTFSGSISASNTLAYGTNFNPLTINTPFTNSAARAEMIINYSLTDSAITGSPGLLVTNLSSGEYQTLSNSFVLSGTQYLSTAILLSPNDVMYVSNMSSGSATAALNKSILKW